MHKRFGPRGLEHWGSARGDWWAQSGRGQEAWQGFGRRMMLRGLMFFGFFLVVVVVLVLGLVSFISDVGGTNVILLILAAPFVLLSAAGLIGRSFILSWRPVRQLIKAAGSLADGDYSVRVAPTSSRSMGPVVASFNDMARRLETADEQRRRLLADLGHELRTPLTVVRGEIEAMLDGVHTIDEDHLSMLLAEVEVMERLLEDLRTLSLLEAGALALYPEPTDLAALLHDVAESFRRRATENGINVVVTADSEIGEIALDQVRMREVLVNLVNNSIRAMPAGGDLHLGAQPAGSGAVITVTDAGVGIPPEDLGSVFDRFHKGSTSSGSGLGLTISRDLVEAHGGRLLIESEPEVGTTVRVDLSSVAAGT